MDVCSARSVLFSPPFLCSLFWGPSRRGADSEATGVRAQQAFRKEPRNLTVRMGATAVLRCEVLRASGAVQWVKDGLLLGSQRNLPGFPRYSMVGNPKRGQFHLQIERARLEDDAPYKCQVGQSESSLAIVSTTAWIDVQIPPSASYMEADMAEPWVAGKMYTVTCFAPDAKPPPEIGLYKDGVELTGAESFTTSGSKDKLLNTRAEVTVMALSSDNGRQLRCQTRGPALARPLETAVTMRVYFPPQPPVIEGLAREEVKAGRILRLVCVSQGGNPLPTLHWTKNGEVLSTSWEEDMEARRSSSALSLQVAPEDNEMVLCCESVNLVSPSALSVTRKITVLFEPTEVTVLGSFTAIEGKALTLSCYTTSSNPPVEIRWWLGSRQLNATVVTVAEGDNGGMTTMSNMTHRVSREENGLPLTCEAFNKGTRFSRSHTRNLNVYYPPLKVWLDGPPQHVPLRSGTTVRLVCFSSGGNPTGTLTWLKNGRPVSNALRQVAFERGVSRELVLVLTASDNMAAYRCDAENEVEEVISAETNLTVHFPALNVKIVAKQKELRRGQNLTLKCLSGSSNPEANISWSLGSHRLAPVEQAARRAAFGGVSVQSSLHLPLTSRNHNQRVVCQAYSPALAEGVNTFYRLNVLYPPEFGPGQPERVQVREDGAATIPALVSANPEGISCVWLRGRQRLVKEKAPRYAWSEDLSLEIRNVTRRDAGVYTVQCSNEEGVNLASVALDVQYAPSVKPEKDPVLVNLGETADLICVADANPVTFGMFSWMRHGEGEAAGGEETQEEESGLLTIHNVTRAHAGRYQCTANNGIAPPASADVQLVVHFKPELQKGPQWRKVASKGDGTGNAEVVCQAEGIPRLHFSWAKNGVPMDFVNPRYEEHTVREGSVHTSTVLVVNVSTALDNAVFTCTARNSLGEESLDVQLVSTSRPDPPSSFHRLGVTHHSVTLKWIPGFDGGLRQRFRIRYRRLRSDSFLYVDVSPPGATDFTVTGLSPSTTYNLSVNALNAMGESDYADNNAVLTLTTEDLPEPEGVPSDGDSGSQSATVLPTYVTVILTVVLGVLLVSNSLGCFLGFRRRRGRVPTGSRKGGKLDEKKSEEAGSSRSTVRSSNRYESGEKINAAAQRTLLVDSGSETESHVYESYARESCHYYYPSVDYRPPLYTLPEETAAHRDVNCPPVEAPGPVYEDVGDFGRRVYQDVRGSSLLPLPPASEDPLPRQRADAGVHPYVQGSGGPRGATDDRSPQRDCDLPFELRGELV